MKTKLTTLALAAAISLAGAFDLQAASKNTPTPSPEPTVPANRASRPLPFNGKIFAIDSVAKTFSIQNKEKKIRIYAITPETKFTKKNLPAAWQDLKIGGEVRGMATPRGNGHYETENIIIGPGEQLAVPAPTAALAPTPTATPSKPSPKPSKKPRATPTPSPTKATD